MGKIEVICGGMFSGKSEELIRRMKRVMYAQKPVLLFKISIDTRYHKSNIVTHDGQSLHAIPVSTKEEMEVYIQEYKNEKPVIGIDEITFFNDDIVDYINNLANDGYRIVVSGLDQDYNGNPFPIMANLLAVADDIIKLHAICAECGNRASKSYRTVNVSDTILIASTDAYKPLCRKCYNNK